MISSSSDGHERRDDCPSALGQLDAPHALATSVLRVEMVELRALAVAGVGDDQQVDSLAGDVAGHDLVAGPQPHAADPGRAASHGTDLGLGEPDRRAALATTMQQVVFTAGRARRGRARRRRSG